GFLLGLAAIWLFSELCVREGPFQEWPRGVIMLLAFIARYFYMPTNCGAPRYSFAQRLLKRSPITSCRISLIRYRWTALTYCAASGYRVAAEFRLGTGAFN